MQKKRLLTAIFAMALILVVAGCNLGDQLLSFKSVTPTVETLTKNAGEQVDFSAVTNKTATLTWSTSGGTLSATTGNNVTWTAPGNAGSYTVTVAATDGIKNISNTWTITVNAATTNHAPVISAFIPANPVTAQIETTKVFSVTATDADNDPLTYTWSSTIGSLDDTTGTTVTWNAPSAAGTGTVKVVISDGTATVEKIWNITVTVESTGNTAPVIVSFTPATPYSMQVNESVELSVVASDDDGDTLTYSWTKTAGTLDANDSDIVNWTAPATASTYTVTVVVSDGTDSATTSWTMNVTDSTPDTVVTVDADITAPTTWAGGKVYVIAKDNFSVYNTLTIEAGAIIKLGLDGADRFDTAGTGIIKALGTSTNPIIFTSIRDDAHGGDTNEDQNASSPQMGDWDAITLWGGSGSIFTYCEFYYGGKDDATLELLEKQAQVKYCTFAHNNGQNYGVLKASDAAIGTVIQNNTFYNNIKPLTINTTFNMDDSNTFCNPANPTEINVYNGIFVPTYAIDEISITWAETEVPFVIENSLNLYESKSLTLIDKVIIKFMDFAHLDVHGTLNAEATSFIIFTSYHDDAHGGDTNGNGQETTPIAGNWNRIWVNGTTSSKFDKCEFYYGGSDGSHVLYLGSTASSVKNCVFAHNLSETGALDATYALYNTVITNNRFYDNNIPLAISGEFSLDDSNIFENEAGTVTNLQNGIFVTDSFEPANTVTWSETDVPFVINSGRVAANKSLNLNDNVVIKFKDGGYLDVYGTLNAKATNKIIFTSFKDDSFLGDTDNDTSLTPERGNWNNIWVDGNAFFTNCEFYYGGSGGRTVNIVGRVEILNSTLAHNSGYALDASNANYLSKIQSNRFFDNEYPLAINVEYSIDNSNNFESLDGTLQNDYNRIDLGFVRVERAITWSETEVPFYSSESISISENYTLNLTDNVILKMGAGTCINIYGSLVQGNNVWFTSLTDDTHGGDSNNDGNLTTPAVADWEGIYATSDWITNWTNILYDEHAYPINYPGI